MRLSMEKQQLNNIMNHRRTRRYSPKRQRTMTCRTLRRQKSRFSPKPYRRRRRVSKMSKLFSWDFHMVPIPPSTPLTQVFFTIQTFKLHRVVEAVEVRCIPKTDSMIDIKRDLTLTGSKLLRRRPTIHRLNRREVHQPSVNLSTPTSSPHSISKTRRVMCAKGEIWIINPYESFVLNISKFFSYMFPSRSQAVRHRSGNFSRRRRAAMLIRFALARGGRLLESSLSLQSVSWIFYIMEFNTE